MKTITYRGEQYEVEDWVEYVAANQDGWIRAFENIPIANGDKWFNTGGQCMYISYVDNEWRDSLEKV